MTEITPFTFPTTGQAVRTLIVDDSPWFVAADVCAALGHSNTSMALALVDEDDRWTLRRSDTLSFAYPFDDLRVQSVNLVNESGLYTLILRSNVTGAREFKRWVTAEVLPSIRKTGGYSATERPAPLQATINRLAELAHDEHVVPVAGRILAFKRWRKPHKGIAAYVQLALDINAPAVGGAAANAKELPGKDVAP